MIHCNVDAIAMKLFSGLGTNRRLRSFLTCSTLGLAIAGLTPLALTQPVSPSNHPSNSQLADPKIEARVDRLLRQMTLEEKMGQLV